MLFSQQDLISIIEQASTITERLDGRFVADEVQQDEEKVDARLQKWCQVVAKGDKEKFAKRLAVDGLDWDGAPRILGSVRQADNQPLPTWIKTLDKAINAAAAVSLESLEKAEYRFLNPKEPVPFEEALVPFIQVARQELLARAGSSYQRLAEAAHAALERSLLQRLSYLGSRVLELEFSIFRVGKRSGFDCFLEPSPDSGSRNLYREFVGGLLAGGLLSLFQEYSVLARLLATATDFWLDATCEFLLRLEADWLNIQQIFQESAELGQVVIIQPGLSECHNNGRSGIALTFASGLKLIYKPKALGLEEAYFQLLAWFNEQGAPLPFKTLKVINRSTYGWVEYVENLPCQDQEEARRYYQRAGMLVCLIYALEGNDCHCENLIACGEHPVLVDLETLMHPRVEIMEDQRENGAAVLTNEQSYNSVLRTQLLPRSLPGPEGRRYETSGLGGLGEQEIPFQGRKWSYINTDSMVLSFEYMKVRPQANVPSLKGVSLSSANYVDDIVDGFVRMYRFVMENREAILAPDSILAVLAHQLVRFLFRPSQVYGDILGNTLNPKYLRHGADRSIELDILSRPLLSFGAGYPFWPLLSVELQAMEQMDIPHLTARSDSDGLTIASDLTIERCFTAAGFDKVISRLNQLNEEDLEHQVGIIRSSLETPFIRTSHGQTTGIDHNFQTSSKLD